MENVVLQRIEKVILHYGISRRAMCVRAGIKPSTWASIVERDSDPKVSYLESILKAFPDVSREWLFDGKEPMLKSSLRPVPENESNGVIIQSLIATVKSQQETIASQQATIDELTEQLKKMGVSPVGIAAVG